MKIKAKCKCGEEVELIVPEFRENEVHHYYHPQLPPYQPVLPNTPLPTYAPPTWNHVIC